MKTEQQLEVINSLIDAPDFDKDKIVISPIGKQSLKVLHPCGCYFVQHGFAGESKFTNFKLVKVVSTDRSFFVELCKKHEKSLAV